MADSLQSPASWDPQRSLYIAAAIAGLAVVVKLLARLPSWIRSLLFIGGLALTPVISVALAYLFKLAYDRYYEQEQAEYDARRLERLAKLRQIHSDFERRSNLHIHSSSPPSRYRYSPTFRHALLQFISHIKADFVFPWYSRISPSSSFPDALERSILHCVDEASLRLSHVNAAEVCASRILPKMTKHFDEYRKLEHLLHSTERSSTSTGSPINLSARHGSVPPLATNIAAILQSHHKHLHPALPATALANPMPSVEAYLRSRVVEPLLKVLLPAEDAQSPAVLAMAREIITRSILMPLVDMMTEPDFWNQLIDDKVSYSYFAENHADAIVE
jgi:phosphate/sulfate permease